MDLEVKIRPSEVIMTPLPKKVALASLEKSDTVIFPACLVRSIKFTPSIRCTSLVRLMIIGELVTNLFKDCQPVAVAKYGIKNLLKRILPKAPTKKEIKTIRKNNLLVINLLSRNFVAFFLKKFNFSFNSTSAAISAHAVSTHKSMTRARCRILIFCYGQTNSPG